MYLSALPVCMCIEWVPDRVRESAGYPGPGVRDAVIVWVLGIEPESSGGGGAASAP